MEGQFLRTKFPASGLLVASTAWPHKYVALVGVVVCSLGAGLQCIVGYSLWREATFEIDPYFP